jgi:alanyl-tRNA synthetase
MPLEQAVQSGAKAFFDDKYSEDVRVVTMGDGVSRELCGGNHVKRTGEVGMIKITRQEAVSSGIRRIYAVCHKSYVDFAAVRESRLQRLVNLLRTTPDEVSNRVQRLLDQNKALAEENHSLEQKLLSGVSKSAGKMRREFSVGTFNGVAEFLGDADKKRLRTAGDTFRNDYDIVFVAGSSKGKTEFVIARTGSVADSDFHSGRVAGALAGDYNLRGGGKAVFAQAGGPEVENPEALLDAFVELAKGGKPRDNA